MKQKKDLKIFIEKSLVLVFFVLFLFFTSNVFAATNLTELPQPIIVNTLKTQSEVTLLNALNNANVISKLNVPATTPSLKNNIIRPSFKFNKVGFSLLGGSIISLGNSITSGYNDFILQPVSGVETATLLVMGDGLIIMGNATGSIYSNYVSFPKLAFSKPKISLPKMNPPNGNMLAAVVNADVNYYATDYNDYILRPVSEFEISTLLKVKEGLIDAGHATSFVYKNIKNINSEQNIAKDISNVASGFYDNYTSKLADVLFASSATKLIAVTKPHTSFLGVFFRNVKNKTSTLFVNIFNAFKDMFTGTIYATNELCINKTCINETQLQVLLKISASYPSNPPQN